MQHTVPPGTEVRIGPNVLCRNWRGKLVRGPRRLAGRKATVIGGPDRDGDLPLKVDGKFYEEQLSPACLTVVREPVLRPAGIGWPLQEMSVA